MLHKLQASSNKNHYNSFRQTNVSETTFESSVGRQNYFSSDKFHLHSSCQFLWKVTINVKKVEFILSPACLHDSFESISEEYSLQLIKTFITSFYTISSWTLVLPYNLIVVMVCFLIHFVIHLFPLTLLFHIHILLFFKVNSIMLQNLSNII